jgi:hypothetical protein
LAEPFSFSEIQKNTSVTGFCSVLCDIIGDKNALLSSGGLILAFEGMPLFFTLSPTADDAIRTSLPKKIRLNLRIHKALFYQGGLLLTATCSVTAPPAFVF